MRLRSRTVRALVLLITLFAVIVSSAPAALATSPAGAATGHSSPGNAALTAALQSRGGTLSPDGRWVAMPSGMQVSVVPMVLADCPSGWLCLWDSASFTGRMLRWSSPGTRDDLSAYGFNDQMTSWANKTNYDARWFYDAGFAGTARCMQPLTSLSNVGTTDNDKASSIAIYTDGAAC